MSGFDPKRTSVAIFHGEVCESPHHQFRTDDSPTVVLEMYYTER